MEPVQPEASVVQTGLGLRYVGDRAYAYSGTYSSTNATQTILDFTTGTGYIVGEVTCNSAIDYSSGAIDAGVITGFQLSLNGEVVALIKVESGNEDAPSYAAQTFIFPPQTLVQLEIIASGNNSSYLNTAHFAGRVYGTTK
jgi:hypothetical protein